MLGVHLNATATLPPSGASFASSIEGAHRKRSLIAAIAPRYSLGPSARAAGFNACHAVATLFKLQQRSPGTVQAATEFCGTQVPCQVLISLLLRRDTFKLIDQGVS